MTWTAIILCIVVLALVYIFFNYFKIKRMSEGTPRTWWRWLASSDPAANTFMKTEFRTIFMVCCDRCGDLFPVCGAQQRYLLPHRRLHEQRWLRDRHEERDIRQCSNDQ